MENRHDQTRPWKTKYELLKINIGQRKTIIGPILNQYWTTTIRKMKNIIGQWKTDIG